MNCDVILQTKRASIKNIKSDRSLKLLEKLFRLLKVNRPCSLQDKVWRRLSVS